MSRGKHVCVGAVVAAALCLVGCATQNNTTDTRQSVRRKPGPNLDREYVWGSRPPGTSDAPHVRD
jgi:hypothetical protein